MLQIGAALFLLSGVVLDPQGLPVPGARVELACRDYVDSVETDARGRFEIDSASDGCRLSVVYRGFAPARQPIGRATEVTIRLRLASVTEVVTVVPEPGVESRRTPSSVVSLSESEMRRASGSTADLIRYATLLAGAAIRPAVVYVDGLPSSLLPPLELIERISVNADPFSAEHADGDVTSIQIVTKAPPRVFRFSGGSDVLGLGGRDVIAAGARATSRGGNLTVMGPVPRLPLTFSARMSLARTSTDVPLQAVLPDGGAHAATAPSTIGAGSITVDVASAAASPFRAKVSYRESRADGSNAGVGGLVLPEAGIASSTTMRDARAVVTADGSRLRYEGGLVVGQSRSALFANSDGAGITVLGDFTRGGAASLAAGSARVRWMSKHVVRSNGPRPWSAGVSIAGTNDSSRQTPNVPGTYQFADAQAYASALSGGRTATWFVTRGNGAVDYANGTLAPFVQQTLVRTARVEIDGGVRADYQSGFGTLVSPRLSLAAEWRGFTVRTGAGLFARSLPAAIFIRAIENDGLHLQQFMAIGVPLVDAGDGALDRRARIRSRLASDLARPRQRMARVSIERRFGGVASGVDYTWTRDTLLGVERLPDGAGWVDVFQANRSAEGHRLYAHAGYAWRGQQLVVNYEWVDASDDTDGPFSFPERAGGLAAEWARSAGAPHNVTAAGTFRLPAAISVNVTQTWRSSAPFNVTTGLDTAGDGLTLDRGGRPRNSGDGPGYNSLAAYGYRRILLPNVFGKSARRLYLNLGVQVDNILDRKNYISVGAIAGSPTFGAPLAAYPGRSIRLFLNVD